MCTMSRLYLYYFFQVKAPYFCYRAYLLQSDKGAKEGRKVGKIVRVRHQQEQ